MRNIFAADQLANYNTQLSPTDERAFQAWRAQLPQNLQGTADYDLRAAFLANAQQAANGHLDDLGKKPNHMTFSDGSKYSTPQTPGGTWAQNGDQWVFFASPTNLRYHDPSDLLNYFQVYEPGNSVVLPKGNPFRR